MAKKNIFDYKHGWFSFDLDWSQEEHKPTLRIQVWRIGLSINFFFE